MSTLALFRVDGDIKNAEPRIIAEQEA